MQTPVLQIVGNEWLWIIFFALILLFGSKKIPEVARGLGKVMGEFQRGKTEIEREIRAASQTPSNNSSPAQTTTLKSQNEEQPSAGKGRLLAAAQALGIDTTGKTDQQVKDEIREAVEKSSLV